MIRLAGWCLPYLGYLLAQGVLWLQPGQPTLLRLSTQGTVLEVWGPYSYTLEGSLTATTSGQSLLLRGQGQGQLALWVAGIGYTLQLKSSPLGYSVYQLRPAPAQPRPATPLPANIQRQLFWVSPERLGYSLLNLGNEPLQLDPSLLEITLGHLRLYPHMERFGTSADPGLLPPWSAQYGLVHLASNRAYRWRWLIPGQQQLYLWEEFP